MRNSHEELMRALDVKGFKNFRIVGRANFICQRCGKVSWRPKLCERCVTRRARVVFAR